MAGENQKVMSLHHLAVGFCDPAPNFALKLISTVN
jgi:hypothetical protein